MQKVIDESAGASANMLSLEDAKKALDEAGIYEIINPLAKEPSQSFKDASEELGKTLPQIFLEYGLSNLYIEMKTPKIEFMNDMARFDLKIEDATLGKHVRIRSRRFVNP